MKKTFYIYGRLGVQAIISNLQYMNMQRREKIITTLRDGKHRFQIRNMMLQLDAGLEHLLVPCFTFTHEERFRQQPWFTGNLQHFEALKRYILAQGWEIEEREFHVPFTNGREMGREGAQALEKEMQYVTTEQQFEATFGLTIDELILQYYDAATAKPGPLSPEDAEALQQSNTIK